MAFCGLTTVFFKGLLGSQKSYLPVKVEKWLHRSSCYQPFPHRKVGSRRTTLFTI